MSQKGKNEIKLFIASSGKEEAIQVVRDVQDALNDVKIPDYEITYDAWCYDGFFENGEYTLESLIEELDIADGAIFIYNGDDVLIKNGKELMTPRANVIFEHGMFVGRLGKKRAYVLLTGGKEGEDNKVREKQTPKLNEVLSDYGGVTWFDYSKVRYKPSGLIDRFRNWIQNSIIKKTDGKKAEDYIISASIVRTGSKTIRDREFELLYEDVESGDRIDVIGMGVTNFLHGNEISTLLNRNVHITVLLMNEGVIKDDWACRFEDILRRSLPKMDNPNDESMDAICPESAKNVLIDKKHFIQYQKRTQQEAYMTKIKEASSLCESYKRDNEDLFEFHKFYSFIPMSMTAIEGKKLIVEYIIPFTDKRILLKVSNDKDPEIFSTFMAFFNSVLTESIKAEKKGKKI